MVLNVLTEHLESHACELQRKPSHCKYCNET